MPIQDRNEKLSRGTERVTRERIAEVPYKPRLRGTPLDDIQPRNKMDSLQRMREATLDDPPIPPTSKHKMGALGDLEFKRQTWGFHEPTITAGAGTEEALQGMAQAMADPRFGMASGMGAIAGVHGLGNLRGRLFKPMGESGGYSVPTAKMLNDEPVLRAYMDAHLPSPGIEGEQAFRGLGFAPDQAREINNTRLPGPRQGYLEQVNDTNLIARSLINPADIDHAANQTYFQEIAGQQAKDQLARVAEGLLQLRRPPQRN